MDPDRILGPGSIGHRIHQDHQVHQDPSGSIRTHQDPSGPIRIHQDPSGTIRIHQDPLGPIRNHQDPRIRFSPLLLCQTELFLITGYKWFRHLFTEPGFSQNHSVGSAFYPMTEPLKWFCKTPFFFQSSGE